MAEELYFFRFNKDTASTRLTTLLKQEDNFSYKQFLEDNDAIYNYEVQFDNILRRIDENIEQLTVEELWSLFNWFSERYEKSTKGIDYLNYYEKLNEEMCRYGLDMFYEIPTKTPVRNFHKLFWNYADLTEKYFGESLDAEDMRGALNYLICYAGELTIFLNRHYYKEKENCELNVEIRKYIKEINLTTDRYYHNLALAELEHAKEYNLETIQLLFPLKEFRRSNQGKGHYSLPEEMNEIERRESALLSMAALYNLALEIKEKLGNYTGKITRLHSC